MAPSFKPQYLICGYHEVVEEEKNLSIDLTLDSSSLDSQENQKKVSGGDSEKESEKTQLTDEQKKKLKEEGWEDLVDRLEKTKDLKKGGTKIPDPSILKNTDVSEKYILRERNYEDIIVKDVYPTLDSIEKSFEELVKESPKELSKFIERNEIIQKYRKNSFEAEEPLKAEISKDELNKKVKKVLSISTEERNNYFDKTLKFSKENQLNDFIEKFISYDPDIGDLPLMFRDLYYKNLQRLAYTFSSDPTYFTIDYFQENLNKEDYLKNAMKLLSDLKGTKTSIEILFSIENIYEIQSNAIQRYFENQNLLGSKTNEIRSETIKRVLERYKPILEKKKLNTYEDVWNIYNKKKLEIMDYALATTPENYRKADILFDKGRIQFEKGYRTKDSKLISNAIQTWNQIKSVQSNGDFLNKKVYEQIIDELNRNGNSNTISKQTESQINSYIAMRLLDSLTQKKAREEKLLWKK